MGDVIPFRKPAGKVTRKGLCQHDIHKWVVCKGKQFDVKSGKLITVYRCERCGKQKVKGH
ncbi:hypothetical protein EB809_12965 [Marinobacter sp. R17]|uniref:hypothetical protein n=1 Tax=Marinobacter TaxID=2742 RepID=UPI000F4BCAB1|nr:MULTISPECIES: hypothetical protein [Marinobacter]ROT98759.1 hypothetical protein EB809_12965 [Marinobacter sp. R17]